MGKEKCMRKIGKGLNTNTENKRNIRGSWEKRAARG
jgi:hypothetical protein